MKRWGHSPGVHLSRACQAALVSLEDPAGRRGHSVPVRHLGAPCNPPQHTHRPPDPLVTYLLSMRADGALGSRETLDTRERCHRGPQGWAPLSPPAPVHNTSSKDLRPSFPVPTQGLTHCEGPGGAPQAGGADRTTHLGPGGALLPRRSWFSLGSLETAARPGSEGNGDGTNRQGR